MRMSPRTVNQILTASFERDNRVAWLHGLYVQQAVMSVASAVLGGNKAKPFNYPDKPIDFNQNSDPEKDAERERLKAIAFFQSWASATAQRYDARAE